MTEITHKHWVSYNPITGDVIQQASGPEAPDVAGATTIEVQTPLDPGAWHFRDGSFYAGRATLDLDGIKAAQWTQLKNHRDSLDNAPVALRDFHLDANQSSRMDIMGAVMAMQLTGQTERAWRCADNVMRTLSLADLVAAGTAIAARRQALIETSDALWQQIQSATTVADVEAVRWPE